jgi:XTP/dITP diphosphohydrolase
MTPTIFIATKNQRKLADFHLYLGDSYTILSPEDVQVHMDVPEGIHPIEDNALAKAQAWAIKTNTIAVGDDTGFFISALYGEPGVATRRWAGELSEEATSEQFWNYLQQKTKNLDDLSCYFKQYIAIYAPNGTCRIVTKRTEGVLDREKLSLPYNGSDYPLAAAFKANNRVKVWDEMSDREKRDFDKELIFGLRCAVEEVMMKHNVSEGKH